MGSPSTRRSIRLPMVAAAALAVIVVTQSSYHHVNGFVVTTRRTTSSSLLPASFQRTVPSTATTLLAATTTAAAPTTTTKNNNKTSKKQKTTSSNNNNKNVAANTSGLSRKEKQNRYMIRRWKAQQVAKSNNNNKVVSEDADNNSSGGGVLLNVAGMTVDNIQRSKTIKGTIYNNKNTNKKKKMKMSLTLKQPTAVAVPKKKSSKSPNKKMKQQSSSKTKTTPKSKPSNKRKTSKKKSTKKPKPSTAHLLPFDTLQPGSIIESAKVVKLLKPYGALIQTNYNIPGKTPGCAMLHISQMPKSQVSSNANANATDISNVLKVGTNITNVRVARINRETNHVELSLLPPSQQRGDKVKKPTTIPKLRNIQIGDEIQAKVLRFKQYGVFVDIGCTRNALLHISRMSLYKVKDMADHVGTIGNTINVRVIKVDDDPATKKTIAVSMLTKEKDDFLNRRDRAIQRMDLWNNVVSAEDEDEAEESKRMLLELDRIISNEMESRRREMEDGNSVVEPRTLEV